MSQELKPCPFCGGVSGLDFQDGSTHRWGTAYCKDCGATAGEIRREYPDTGKWHAEAIAAWNKRAQPAVEAVAIQLLPEALACIGNLPDGPTDHARHRSIKARIRALLDARAPAKTEVQQGIAGENAGFEHHPATLADVDLIRALQRALFYWMPSIAGEDTPYGKRAAEDAYLLVGLDDNSTACAGDEILRYIGVVNQANERMLEACREAGCPDDCEDAADWIVANCAAPPAAANQAGTWQPIETAPKDGTEILLRRDARVTSGAWIEWTKTASEYHATTGEYLGQVEQDSSASWQSWDGGFIEEQPPTHWMPLHAAPTESHALEGDGE